MKVVRGRADGRWLPSRFNFALFRLFAFLRMRNATPKERDVALIIDRNQNAIESFALSVWIPLTLACYVAAMLPARWPRPIALICAIPIAVALPQIAIIIFGTLVIPLWNAMTRGRVENVMRVTSAGMMLLFFTATLWIALSQSWARFVAWHVLVLAGLNAIAAGILFLLRGAMADLESSVGGFSSEV
jgi:hypothetical protein